MNLGLYISETSGHCRNLFSNYVCTADHAASSGIAASQKCLLFQAIRWRLELFLGPQWAVSELEDTRQRAWAELLQWTDDDGRTALVVAAAKNHLNAVKLVSCWSAMSVAMPIAVAKRQARLSVAYQ